MSDSISNGGLFNKEDNNSHDPTLHQELCLLLSSFWLLSLFWPNNSNSKDLLSCKAESFHLRGWNQHFIGAFFMKNNSHDWSIIEIPDWSFFGQTTTYKIDYSYTFVCGSNTTLEQFEVKFIWPKKYLDYLLTKNHFVVIWELEIRGKRF